MPLIPDNRPPTPTRPAKKALFKGVMVAALLHLIFVLAYLYASGHLGDRPKPAAPEAASVPLEPKSTIVVAAPRHAAPEMTDAPYVYKWSDAHGVQPYANSNPPVEARDVEGQVETKSTEPDSPAAVDAAKVATPIVAAKAAKPALAPLTTSSPKIPDAWVAREKARLEKELAYYEDAYRRRGKAVISIEEKEDLLRPINETKAKLQKLQASPEEYFGLMKRY